MDKKDLEKRKSASGKRIKELREAMGLSKERFAKIIGMSGQYLGTLERGIYYISTDKLVSLCEKLGVSADYILFGKENDLDQKTKKFLSELDDKNLSEALKTIEKLAIFINERIA